MAQPQKRWPLRKSFSPYINMPASWIHYVASENHCTSTSLIQNFICNSNNHHQVLFRKHTPCLHLWQSLQKDNLCLNVGPCSVETALNYVLNPQDKVAKHFIFLYTKSEERSFVQKAQLRMASWKGERESKSYFSRQYYLSELRKS